VRGSHLHTAFLWRAHCEFYPLRVYYGTLPRSNLQLAVAGRARARTALYVSSSLFFCLIVRRSMSSNTPRLRAQPILLLLQLAAAGVTLVAAESTWSSVSRSSSPHWLTAATIAPGEEMVSVQMEPCISSISSCNVCRMLPTIKHHRCLMRWQSLKLPHEHHCWHAFMAPRPPPA